MDAKHLTGIDEIDAQHREIHEVATAAIAAIQSGDKWHIVHYILVRLHELLRFHFAVEESVMRIVQFSELDAHKLVHKEYLATIEALRDASLQSDRFDVKAIGEKQLAFLEHILDHDLRLAEHVRARIGH